MLLKEGSQTRFFLAPYNSGYHWTLTVVNTTEDLVYYMDPSKRRMDITTDEWKTIVNHAIKIADAHIPTKKARKVQWKNYSGILEQIGDKTCGYFIMLYMREIVLDKNQDWSKKWLTRGDAYYTMGNVDVVREEWAKYVLKFTNN